MRMGHGKKFRGALVIILTSRERFSFFAFIFLRGPKRGGKEHQKLRRSFIVVLYPTHTHTHKIHRRKWRCRIHSQAPSPSAKSIETSVLFFTADNLSDDRAEETYAKILGTVFSPVPFQYETLLTVEEQEVAAAAQTKGGLLSAALQAVSTASLRPLFLLTPVKLLQDVDLYGLSWHQHKNILAFVSGPNHVTIRDYEDSDGKDPCVLINESQKQVKSLEWRPNGGRMLSVACKGGICIWAASYPGNPALVRGGVTSSTLSRGSGTRWTLVDFLQSHDGEQISALSWSPDGRYLASASFENSSFTIWDVAQGMGRPIRRGLGGISLIKWSPSGDYFIAAKFDGTFHIWETNTWTSEPWSSTNGFVTGATWDPDGRMILIAFSESTTLGSLHFASKPPSLVLFSRCTPCTCRVARDSVLDQK
ncbi:aladin isoform X3 [Coffea arabica]|uniref:Aladin isoform X3 n=1 Tax=Coffea arabica TaxID=13443 RepID=A0ABM4UXR5_COFAR